MTVHQGKYQIIIRQHLRLHLAERVLPGFSAVYDFDDDHPVTILTGEVIDQSAMLGMLLQLSALNLQLVSIIELPDNLREGGNNGEETNGFNGEK